MTKTIRTTKTKTMNLHWSNEQQEFIELSELDQYKLSLHIYRDLLVEFRRHIRRTDYEYTIFFFRDITWSQDNLNLINQILSE